MHLDLHIQSTLTPGLFARLGWSLYPLPVWLLHATAVILLVRQGTQVHDDHWWLRGTAFAVVFCSISWLYSLVVQTFEHDRLQSFYHGRRTGTERYGWHVAILFWVVFTAGMLLALPGNDFVTACVLATVLTWNSFLGRVVSHLISRVVLAVKDVGPLRYGAFLRHCIDLTFLRQTPDGVQFSHALIREYFAVQGRPRQRPASENSPS